MMTKAFQKMLRDIKSKFGRFLPFLILQGLWYAHLHNSVVVAIGFSSWKEGFVRRYFRDKVVVFINNQISLKLLIQILKNSDLEIVIWSFKDEEMDIDISVCAGKAIWRMEDGFIRSIGLGIDQVVPWSLCLDSQGSYFDASRPSDFEDMCNQFDQRKFTLQQQENAYQLILEMKKNGISKYNVVDHDFEPKNFMLSGSGVLVLGQVEGDQSILRNENAISTNKGLLEQALLDFPGQPVFFKQHPDCLGERKRPGYVSVGDFPDVVEIPHSMSIIRVIDGIDEVYTISSLGGFEALLRGKRVTTFGAPFYAGWGLTTDHVDLPNRKNVLSVEQLFHLSYIEYASYFNPKSGERISIQEVIDHLSSEV